MDMHCDSDEEVSSDDNKEEEPRTKKTRIASPLPMVKDERTSAARELKARRLVVLRALIIHLNSTFRLQVVKKVAAG